MFNAAKYALAHDAWQSPVFSSNPQQQKTREGCQTDEGVVTLLLVSLERREDASVGSKDAGAHDSMIRSA